MILAPETIECDFCGEKELTTSRIFKHRGFVMTNGHETLTAEEGEMSTCARCEWLLVRSEVGQLVSRQLQESGATGKPTLLRAMLTRLAMSVTTSRLWESGQPLTDRPETFDHKCIGCGLVTTISNDYTRQYQFTCASCGMQNTIIGHEGTPPPFVP